LHAAAALGWGETLNTGRHAVESAFENLASILGAQARDKGTMRTGEESKRFGEVARITLIALAIRLAFVPILYRNTYNSFSDHLLFGFETGRIARSIVTGHGYGNPLAAPTGPTAWMTPVYPYLLAAVFKLFGIYTRNSAFVILGLNSLFSALICVPMYFIARRSFGRGVAVLSCWLWALFPYSIYLASGFVWETCLSALLLALLFLWTLRLKEQPGSGWTWLGFGALWGLAAMTNASVLSLGPFFTLWAIGPLWRDRKKWLASGTLVLAGLLLVAAPWQVRNYETFHRFIPLRSDFWLEFWVGNDGYTGYVVDLRAHPTTSQSALDEFVRLGETAFMQRKRSEVLGYISRHPGFYLKMCLRRVVYIWTGIWSLAPQARRWEFEGPESPIFVVPFTLLMILGLALARRADRPAVPLYWLLFGIYPIVYYFTHSHIRYRHMMDPEILILAALTLHFAYGRVSAAGKPSP
jgi:4-amino-4-deoxy-L-arabinose transferase-like glycosyltransferase